MSTLTTRGLFRKAALTDGADAAVLAGQLGDDIDAKILLWAAGTTGGMPASASDGKLYHDTTLDRLLYDMGTTWRKLIYQNAAGIYAADNIVDATGYRVSGTALAASNLSNGVTGSGSVVLAASPTLSGAPLSATPSVDDNTTKIATTAFYFGQVSASTPIIDGTGAVGTSTKWARADHVHPTDTSRAALVSPTFTGVPAAPTATVGTNTTQLATTAFVLANGSANAITGDNASRKLRRGTVNNTFASPVSVTFASAFANTPSVVATVEDAGGGDQNSVAMVKSVSTSGFTLQTAAWFGVTGTTSYNVHWHASDA